MKLNFKPLFKMGRQTYKKLYLIFKSFKKYVYQVFILIGVSFCYI